MQLAIYLVIIGVYLPGIFAILFMRRLGMMPVITFTFLGMFFFTALGSYLIIFRSNHFFNSLFSPAYAQMLVLQALLFYVVAGPYVAFRKPAPREHVVALEDNWLMSILIGATMLILTAYYLKVGKFLLFDLLAGHISRVNVLQFRALTWGLPEYPIFRLGFFVFPALIAAQRVAAMSIRGKLNKTDLLVILACLIPILLPGEKAGLLQMAAILFIAYSLHLGSRNVALGSAINPKVIAASAVALIPTLVAYHLYFSDAGSFGQLADAFVFRVIGSYSEALAATVRYTEIHGFLAGSTLPTFKGLFPHDRIFLDQLMHSFLAAGTELKGQPIAGGIPVPANGEGYINFGWPGFVFFSTLAFFMVVALQELLLRLQLGTTSTALMTWHAYLGLTLSTSSLFGTFISLVHGAVAAFVIGAWLVIQYLLKKKNGHNSDGR